MEVTPHVSFWILSSDLGPNSLQSISTSTALLPVTAGKLLYLRAFQILSVV